MNITTEPFEITKPTFFRRVCPKFHDVRDTFDVYPSTQHDLNIVKTILVIPEGTAYSVSFAFDGVLYHLERESKFVPNAVA
jgi:hypothetical protein